jgi:2'-5' RNA ligase
MTTAAIRAFIAIELPSELQGAINQVMTGLQQHAGKAIRWVTPRNIHLTLKFLGNVSPTNLNALINVINNEALRHKPFDITVGSIGAYPNKIRPRIVWVGVQAPTILLELQHGIDRETDRLGYPSEERGFSPHLTLGRVSQHANSQEVKQIADTINSAVVGEIGKVSVDSIRLYRSDLQAGGAIYTSLLCSPLNR